MASALQVAAPSLPPTATFSRSDTGSSLNLGRPSSSASGHRDTAASIAASTPATTPQTQRTQMSYFRRPSQGPNDVILSHHAVQPYQQGRDSVAQTANGGQPQIYTAIYSGVSVYEMEVNRVAVMRRRCDSWLNATQILKVAGVDKGKRTKVLEKEILVDEHEKVQGGYGKYQGTWINYHRGVQFCRQYGVEELLRPLLEYDMGQDGVNAAGQGIIDTPTKEQAMAAQRKRQYNSSVDHRSGVPSANGTFFKNISSMASNAVAAMSKAKMDPLAGKPGTTQRRRDNFRRPSQQHMEMHDVGLPSGSQNSMHSLASEHSMSGNGPVDSTYGTQSGLYFPAFDANHDGDLAEPPRKRARPSSSFNAMSQTHDDPFDVRMRDSTPTEPNESFVYHQDSFQNDDDGVMAQEPLPQPMGRAAEEKKQLLMSLFLDQNQTDFSAHPAFQRLSGRDLDLPLDSTAHTALHWAATLARLPLLKALTERGASIFRVNTGGETALIRAVLVTNNHDQSTFSELLQILGPTMEIRDGRGRTVLHHIAVSSAVSGRSAASRYYLNGLLEFVVRRGQAASGQGSQSLVASAPPTLRTMGLAQFIREIVDAQDKSGDTALNIAARINNTKMISQLLEIGADTALPNRAGLKPLDFGIGKGDDNTKVHTDENQPPNEESKSHSTRDGESSKEIMSSLSSLFSKIEGDFVAQLRVKQDLIDSTHVVLREKSLTLGEERRKLANLQQQVKDRANKKRKIANLRRAVDEQKAISANEPIYGNDDTVPLEVGIADTDWKIPASEGDLDDLDVKSLPPLRTLRARLAAYNANNAKLQGRASRLHSLSSELEDKYRRVISLCTKVPEAEVDKLMDNLVAAVESEGADSVDLGRVRDFLRKAESVA